MKLGLKSGSRKRSQKGCRMFVGLLLVLILVLSVGWPSDIPVVKATEGWWAWLEGGSYPAHNGFLRLRVEASAGITFISGTVSCSGGSLPFLGAPSSGSMVIYESLYNITSPGTVMFSIETSAGMAEGVLGYTFNGEYSLTDGSVYGWQIGTSLDMEAFTAPVPDPVGVSISGSDNVSVGTSYTYDATITPGTPPYSVQFTRSSTDHPADDLTYAVQSGSGTSWSQAMTFPSIDDAYEVSVTVTDSASPATSDTDTMVVNAAAGKPVLYGALVRGTNGTPSFALFSASPGSPPDMTAGILTSSYVVTSPEWLLKGAREYVLNVSGTYANPLKVYVTYTSPLNGLEWTYVFSFDTTSMSDPGDYDTSDDVPGDGADVIPTWLQGLVNSIKDMLDKLFRFLFVPTSAQIAQLLPSGTLGATLLEGTAWDTGASTWSLHTHWDSNVIQLVEVDFSDLGTFGSTVKVIVQAGMCLALIYMVVVLL